MGRSRSSRSGRVIRCAFGILLSIWLCSRLESPASAQDQGTLLRMLSQGQSFRVRARAALALGRAGDERALSGLEAALADPEPAVREAAAAALGQIGARRSVPALRAAAADAVSSVAVEAKQALRAIAAREQIARAVSRPAEAGEPPPAPPTALTFASVRYAVVLGQMRDQSDLHDARLAEYFAARIGSELRKLDHVAVFSLSEMSEEIAKQLARRNVPMFRVEANLNRLERVREADESRVRCEVSLLLMDEPERTLRGLLRGSASSSEEPFASRVPPQKELLQRTVQGAVHSAMANAWQAIEAAAIRRDLGLGDIRAEASLSTRLPRRAKH